MDTACDVVPFSFRSGRKVHLAGCGETLDTRNHDLSLTILPRVKECEEIIIIKPVQARDALGAGETPGFSTCSWRTLREAKEALGAGKMLDGVVSALQDA
jgi:hypothetical protein